MTDSAPTRRSVLSYLTGGGVAVGALTASSALLRSCAPDAEVTSYRDRHIFQPPLAGKMVFEVDEGPLLIKRLTHTQKAALLALDNDLNYPGLNRFADDRPVPPATAQNTLYGAEKDLLVLLQRCTRVGCHLMEGAGDWRESGGFLCPCCGAHFDGLGRHRKNEGRNNMLSPELTLLEGGRYRVEAIPTAWNRVR